MAAGDMFCHFNNDNKVGYTSPWTVSFLSISTKHTYWHAV